MTAVMIVDFSENAVTGALPPFGVDNTALQCVAMSGNQLTGSIPASLGAAPVLRFVALVSGPIPAALGDAGHLEALLPDGNDLSGPSLWSALFRLKQLRHLRLDGNPRLTGAVSGKAIVDAFPQLLALELAGSSGITLQWDDDRLSDLHLLTLPSPCAGRHTLPRAVHVGARVKLETAGVRAAWRRRCTTAVHGDGRLRHRRAHDGRWARTGIRASNSRRSRSGWTRSSPSRWATTCTWYHEYRGGVLDREFREL
jgi:hypothetical protein